MVEEEPPTLKVDGTELDDREREKKKKKKKRRKGEKSWAERWCQSMKGSKGIVDSGSTELGVGVVVFEYPSSFRKKDFDLA